MDASKPANVRQFVGWEFPIGRPPDHRIFERDIEQSHARTVPLQARRPRLITLVDLADIVQRRVLGNKIDVIGFFEIREVTDGVVDERIVGLPGGMLINFAVWVVRRIKDIRGVIAGIAIIERRQPHIHPEAIDRLLVIESGDGIKIKAVPIGSGGITLAGVNLAQDSVGRRVNRGRVLSAIRAPEAAGC